MLQQQEAYARAIAMEYETSQGQFTIFGHPYDKLFLPSLPTFHALQDNGSSYSTELTTF